MSQIEIFILALALSVDACVVSFSYGLLQLKNPTKDSIMIALTTGLFQAVMPVFGYCLTTFLTNKINTSPFAKYIIFIIFLFLGIKFIKDSFENKNRNLCIGLLCLILIGIGTSIDAFSAGILLKLSGNLILKSAILIGIVTSFNSFIGFTTGRRIKHLPAKHLEIFAGMILIFLGIKALL